MIKLIIFDIDGVITDGSIIVDQNGTEQKKLNLKDIDAIFELKNRGFEIAAITGENTAIVDYFEKKFPWSYFYKGCKKKLETIKAIEQKSGISSKEICYIGDGKYDIDAIEYCELGICPLDSVDKVKEVSNIILQNKAGEGCLWELLRILENYNNPNSHNYFYERIFEHTNLFRKIASDIELIDQVMSVSQKMAQVLSYQNQVFLCGNGGSAADAQHIATEFVSRFYKERKALNVEALTVNTSTLTAISNDYSYERIFVRQLEAKAKKGDMIIGISTSGKSKNVIEALRYAKEEGLMTVMMTGNYNNEELNQICDYIIKIPSNITPRIQEAHIFIGHLIAEYVEHKFFEGEK